MKKLIRKPKTAIPYMGRVPERIVEHLEEAETAPAIQNPEEMLNTIGQLLGKVNQEDRIKKAAQEGVDKAMAEWLDLINQAMIKRVEIVTPTNEIKDIGLQHKQFPKLLELIGARQNVMLVGPAGSFKTRSSYEAAKALGLPFYSISVSSQTSKSDLAGFMNAMGVYNRSQFRNAFEKGGVFLLDEIDNGNPNTVSLLNAAIENNVTAFPDGMIERHKDFIVIASANTYGTGANTNYIGRNALDGATLNRFVRLPWDYDEEMEMALSEDKEWTNIVQKMRKIINEKNISMIVSPRQTFQGSLVKKFNWSLKDKINIILLPGMNPVDKEVIIKEAITKKIIPANWETL